MTVPLATPKWRKSSRSSGSETCVELASDGLMRDSKNPAGPVLPVDLGQLLAAVKTGRIG
jgi:hypothetical protein